VETIYVVLPAPFKISKKKIFKTHSRRAIIAVAAQQSAPQFVVMIAINLVITKAAAQRELLFNKPASGN